MPANKRPTLENVRAIPVQDLESQDHILEYQLPAAVQRFGAGLIVIDSIAANYRAEHSAAGPKAMSDRSTQLTKVGHLLRTLAARYELAVVVANQVSDRFESMQLVTTARSSSPVLSSSPVPQSSAIASQDDTIGQDALMSLDHQQRFFSGWGDESMGRTIGLKTPALGLTWTNQIACRIALKLETARADVATNDGEYLGGNIWKDRKKRRFFKVVFAPWTAGMKTEGEDVEYEIRESGLVALGQNPEDT